MQLVDRQTTRPAFAHWSQCIVEQTVKFIECHAWQRTNIHMQLTASTNTVRSVAAVNMPEVERRVWHGKRVVVITFFQVIAQLQNMPDGVVHQFDSVNSACWIAGVARLALNTDGVRDMTFMGAYRLQRRWLANDGAIRAQGGSFGKITRSGHTGFFIGSRQNVERFCKLRDVDIA